MKQATLFVCAFAVLFQLYSGAEALNATDSIDVTTPDEETVVDDFEDKVANYASIAKSAVMDQFMANTDSVNEFIDEVYNQAIDLENFELATMIGEWGTVATQSSYKNSQALSDLIRNFISVLEVGIVSGTDSIKLFTELLVNALNNDEASSDDIEFLNVLVSNLEEVSETSITTNARATTANFDLMSRFMDSLVILIETQSEITTDMIEANKQFLKASVPSLCTVTE